MQSRPSIFLLLFRVCVRLGLGLVLLIGLGAVMGGLARSAHAATAITVSTCDESHLDAAISQANSDNAGDTITFSCSGDITLTSTLTISGSMTLDGRGQSVTLDGQHQRRVMFVNSGVTLTLKVLTIANGSNPNGFGGGLENFGTVSISNSTFATNSAGFGGGLDNENFGTVSISNSTFATNSAPNLDGGGLFNDGGTVSISNSTFATNSAGEGGGLFNESTASIGGSIVANNTGGNCFLQFGGVITSTGYNLESGTDCGLTSTGDLQNTDPKLGPLASNGGPTQTMALLKGSPAIDYIPLTSSLCPATDQRGHKRPDNPHEGACDIGAYES
jgi:hypothetical protein